MVTHSNTFWKSTGNIKMSKFTNQNESNCWSSHSDTVIFQYSLVDTFNEDDDVDGDMWDYRKLFLDFSISYLGGFLEMHASQSSRFSQ